MAGGATSLQTAAAAALQDAARLQYAAECNLAASDARRLIELFHQRDGWKRGFMSGAGDTAWRKRGETKTAT